jgi:hypothetical protein
LLTAAHSPPELLLVTGSPSPNGRPGAGLTTDGLASLGKDMLQSRIAGETDPAKLADRASNDWSRSG